jgi:RNA 2'-phosphotransferase, Tpt1 / KptA family
MAPVRRWCTEAARPRALVISFDGREACWIAADFCRFSSDRTGPGFWHKGVNVASWPRDWTAQSEPQHSRCAQKDRACRLAWFGIKLTDDLNENETIRTSKFLSLILRHEPGRVGLQLDRAGWAKVDELVRAANRHSVSLNLDHLKCVVPTNDKKRFAFSGDGLRIRASQGHSIKVDLQ